MIYKCHMINFGYNCKQDENEPIIHNNIQIGKESCVTNVNMMHITFKLIVL